MFLFGVWISWLQTWRSRVNDNRSVARQMMKWCIVVKGAHYVKFENITRNMILSIFFFIFLSFFISFKWPYSLSERLQSLWCEPCSFFVYLPNQQPSTYRVELKLKKLNYLKRKTVHSIKIAVMKTLTPRWRMRMRCRPADPAKTDSPARGQQDAVN